MLPWFSSFGGHPAAVREKALPHDSEVGAGPADSHDLCVDLEKNLLTPLKHCHTLHQAYLNVTFCIFKIVHCTVLYVIKLYCYKSTKISVPVVF